LTSSLKIFFLVVPELDKMELALETSYWLDEDGLLGYMLLFSSLTGSIFWDSELQLMTLKNVECPPPELIMAG
jgi:hypothetical protein